MGKTIVKTKFYNTYDLADVKRGFMNEAQVRIVEREGIVDTGAVFVSLPRNLVEQLGLDIVAERKVRYANGKIAKCKIAGGLLVEIRGRTAELQCLVQEDDNAPILIGQIALEAMDWAVNPQTQQLIPGHDEDHEMGLIEMYGFE